MSVHSCVTVRDIAQHDRIIVDHKAFTACRFGGTRASEISVRAQTLLGERLMTRFTLVVAAMLGCLAGSGAANALTLTSPDIKPDAKIADEQVFNGFGCTGANVSPELNWSDAPKGTKSFALSVYDPDAPTGSGFWHWVVFNIPPDITSLAKGAGDPKRDAAPKGVVQSRTDFGILGYGGPCPPKGDKPHHYQFTIFAVDIDKLDADENATAASIGFNLHFHTLAKATLTGVWGH
jgi:Raf kinase inhibitor-like YbhB/YbcL family protein